MAPLVACGCVGGLSPYVNSWRLEAFEIPCIAYSISNPARIMAWVKKLIFLTLWVVVMATGVFLGAWQLDRLAWKTAWLDRIDQAYRQPVGIKQFNLSDLPCTSLDRTFFIRTSVRVAYDLDPTRTYIIRPRVVDGMFGKYIYTRAILPNGVYLWINRGFVPDGTDIPPPPKSSKATIQIRSNDIPVDHILQDNPRVTSDDLRSNPSCIPLSVLGVIEQSDLRTPWPLPVGTRPIPSNDHLNYAIFWFVMSGIAALMGGYIVLNAKIRHCNVLRYENNNPLDI